VTEAQPITRAPTPPNGILSRMLDRLFAAITSGPSLNCRPHASRQRLDLTQLGKLGDVGGAEVLARLLGPGMETKLVARVPQPPASAAGRLTAPVDAGGQGEPVENAPAPDEGAKSAAQRAWADQQSLLTKLRIIAEEARTYEDDTGVSVLAIGFPLLSVPAGTGGTGGRRGQTRRVLAPIAFIPVTLTTRTGASPSIEISCRKEDIDRVSPNEALLAWIAQQTGKAEPELFGDEEGADPWREICGLVAHVAGAFGLPLAPPFDGPAAPESLALVPAPRAEDETGAAIVPAAVLGLFPVANQGLLRDTQAMLDGERHAGPVESFLRADAALTAPRPDEPEPAAEEGRAKRARVYAEERLVAPADPCQGRAVAMAREAAALVVHGPPGTGKSQTITNIIGDSLARGERVLFVCDKRTALDVVYNRLEHLGLSSLCALIHDPQRDQRDLYMAIREQLEGLSEAKLHPRAQGSLAKADEELQQLHAELTRHHERLALAPGESGRSFHELVGEWLAIPEGATARLDAGLMGGLSLEIVEGCGMGLTDILRRAQEAAYPTNPWVGAAGIGLDAFLARPMDSVRESLRVDLEAAAVADATCDPEIPPFSVEMELAEQGVARESLAGMLAEVGAEPASVRTRWIGTDGPAIARARRATADAGPARKTMQESSLESELGMIVRERVPTAAEIAGQLGAIEAYLATARAWYGAVMIGRRGAAAKVLRGYGLPLTPEAGERVRVFLTTLRALLAGAALVESFGERPAGGLPDVAELEKLIGSHSRVLDLMGRVHEEPALRGLRGLVVAALAPAADAAGVDALVRGLRASPARAAALARLEAAMASEPLFSSRWVEAQRREFRGGGQACPVLEALRAALPTLEGVLRVGDGLARLPEAVRKAGEALVAASASAEQGIATLRRGALGAEIGRRLATDPELRNTDARRLETVFARVRELEGNKHTLVRDAVLHTWVSRQQARLLVGTGSRLNSAGAEVRRRLTVRGRRAMRLRQVLAMGRGTEGGDPIMDLRPVWMASPETVAQVFPREAIFDVVVFDEASQCRLEEALPVLTRARRVVIAGDPKQLPPTRFFEAAIAASDTDEIETDQQLFEAQQGEVEDLLGAALNLDIESCYLDVHYRSRNADLIAFSNTQFYSSRLQPIPAHPSNRAKTAPITLYRAGGVYDKRVNEVEADEVCRIVAELLKEPKPPSIGIGCFNLAQRDVIAEKLDDLGAADAEFGRRLATARERRGKASFEGLFIKNLENVQGDERDHIIISTTYGPDAKGRFYRRFGPLAMPGGGRRLNVLVTRARERVHLVTSIPAAVYTALPPVPTGQTAGGGWLLFAYLSYAEALEKAYQGPASLGPAPALDDASSEQTEGAVSIRPSRWPSRFAEALAGDLSARAGVGSQVYWGNDGFCVDVALRHPERPDDVTLGVLCDSSRYALADDPVEWDLFRTAVLEGQGWKLSRVWSPAFFRDASGLTDSLLTRAREVAAPTRQA
jgi:hypothetical protein